MQAEARQQRISMEAALIRALTTRSLGRMAEPSEIANAVVYLASKRAGYFTVAFVAMAVSVQHDLYNDSYRFTLERGEI